jgi:hypothetical protein
MTRPTMDDPFDRQLRGFLDWQAEQVGGAPSAAEITERLAAQGEGRFGRRFGSARVGGPATQFAWAFLIVALLAAAVIAVAFIGGQNHRTSVVLPTASPTVSPTTVSATLGARCPTPAELIPAGAVEPTAGLQDPASPLGAYLAAGVRELRVAVAGSTDSRLIATIRSQDAPNNSDVLGWSNDGSAILVHLGVFNPGGSLEENCGDLWLVRSDGSAATKLTGDDPGADASAAVLAGSGRSVAYLSGKELRGSALEVRLADASGASTVLASAPCYGNRELLWPFGSGRLAWSPDGTRLAILCTGNNVTIYSVADGTSLDLTLQRETLAQSMAWSADGSELMVAAVPYGSGNNHGPLTIVAIDSRSDVIRLISHSSVDVEWIVGEGTVDAFSPDGAWFLASGGTPGAVPGANFTSTWYVIEVATGVARQVFDKDEPCCGEWLPDSSGFMYLDPQQDNVLVQADVNGKRVATLGLIEGWGAWHWLYP